jgi:hypothetical protein
MRLTPTAEVYGNLTVRFRQEHLAGNEAYSRQIDEVIKFFEKEWPEDCARFRAMYSRDAALDGQTLLPK